MIRMRRLASLAVVAAIAACAGGPPPQGSSCAARPAVYHCQVQLYLRS